ncbi:MAG: hypothetical protein FWG74_09290, partial [Planctomycetes bacterium]|nr:hypothetical protein [Planctomycetota bacterium]
MNFRRLSSRTFRNRVGLLTLGLVLAVLPGCTDIPIIQPPPGEDQPIGPASVVLGPYLTSSDGMQPFLRFVSNRRSVAGIQVVSSASGVERKYVNRQASFSLFHSLAIPELDPAAAKRYQLWLGDQDGGLYAIRGLPRSGQAAAIAFAGGGTAGGNLDEIGRRLRALEPNAVVFTSPPFQPDQPVEPPDWEMRFFGPIGDKVALGPLWFAPGGNLPAELFPEHAAEGGYWKRDIGALRLIGIDARAFSFESSRSAVLTRLDRDIDPSHRRRAWTVIVLSRSAFDARIGDGRILGSLGDRMELGGVDLVIGAGGYYLRTRPFSICGVGQTRYISLSGNPSGPAPGLTPREYVAAITGQPHVARLWADEGTLEWQLFDLQGNPIDILTLEARRPAIEPTLSMMDVAADAQAALTLQREILGIVRQAARAVPEPDRQMLLSLYFANPTPRRFTGRLSWDIPAGSGWHIEPSVMPFDLQPGQGAVARFGINPGTAALPPILTASGVDVGTSSDRLFITREKRYDVYPAPEPIRLDARVHDKNYWKTLPVLSGLETEAGLPPANPTEARITADQAGLIVAISMAASQVSSVNPKAGDTEADHDGPVLDDESVEVFIDPGRRGREYYHFAINPRNVVLDSSSRAGLAYNPNWQHQARFGRVGSLETWNVEMRIPWEALGLAGPPAPNSEWGFQIARRDYSAAREAEQKRIRAAPPPEISQWAQTGGDNTRSGLYGILRFGDLSAAPDPSHGRRAEP